jgi:hypothetical protein
MKQEKNGQGGRHYHYIYGHPYIRRQISSTREKQGRAAQDNQAEQAEEPIQNNESEDLPAPTAAFMNAISLHRIPGKTRRQKDINKQADHVEIKNPDQRDIYGMKVQKEGEAPGVAGNYPPENSQRGQKDGQRNVSQAGENGRQLIPEKKDNHAKEAETYRRP